MTTRFYCGAYVRQLETSEYHLTFPSYVADELKTWIATDWEFVEAFEEFEKPLDGCPRHVIKIMEDNFTLIEKIITFVEAYCRGSENTLIKYSKHLGDLGIR